MIDIGPVLKQFLYHFVDDVLWYFIIAWVIVTVIKKLKNV